MNEQLPKGNRIEALSLREWSVLQLLDQHLRMWEIADELEISDSAVKNDVRSIVRKLRVRNVNMALRVARSQKFHDSGLSVESVAAAHLEVGKAVDALFPERWDLLSSREREIVLVLSDPDVLDMKEMVLASYLGIAPNTLKTHFRRIYQKLGVRTRAHLAVLAQQAIRAEKARAMLLEREVGDD